jgi:hypothetical protein
MNKCHRISEGYDVDSTVGDSLWQLCATLQYLCSVLQKSSFILLNIETKHIYSRVPHEKLALDQQVLILIEAEDKNTNK